MLPINTMSAFAAVGILLLTGETTARRSLSEKKDNPLDRIGNLLTKLYEETTVVVLDTPEGTTDEGPQNLPSSNRYSKLLGVDRNGRVPIEIVAEGEGRVMEDLVADLTALGFKLSATYSNVASGKIPVKNLAQVIERPYLKYVRPSIRRAKAGLVQSQGVQAMNIDKLRGDDSSGEEAEKAADEDSYSSDDGPTGRGIKIGVLSDSYDNKGGAADDIASGDLPSSKNIDVILDLGDEQAYDDDYYYDDDDDDYYEDYDDLDGNSGSDEGRAMMQLIHDVAPGAKLAFRTAFNGQPDFARGIEQLAEAGCDVIVDDILYDYEPWFQDGMVARAISKVATEYGVTYFTPAGNEGLNSYESDFRPIGKRQWHNFSPSAETRAKRAKEQRIFLPNADEVGIILQWDEPYAFGFPDSPGSQSDLDLLVFDANKKRIAISADNNTGADPYEAAYVNVRDLIIEKPERAITVDGREGIEVRIRVELFDGAPPDLIKIVVSNPRAKFLEYETNSSTLVGHFNAPNAASVAAANFAQTPRFGVDPAIREFFSAKGGTPILFDERGNRFNSPDLRIQPRLTGPDGTNTTFFPSEEKPVFFGTSAAAPHVAAVAALMLQVDATLKPPEIFKILEKTAWDMETSGYDFLTGFGLVDARRAVERVEDLSGSES